MKKLFDKFRNLHFGYQVLYLFVFTLFVLFPIVGMISDAIGHPVVK